MTMKKTTKTQLIEKQRQHGDIAEVARRAGVKYQTAYQYIGGNRKRGRGRFKYLEILANVIADRANMEKLQTENIEKLLPCTLD